MCHCHLQGGLFGWVNWALSELLLALIVLKNSTERACSNAQIMSTMRGSCDHPVVVHAGRTVKKPKKVGGRAARARKSAHVAAQILNQSVADPVQAVEAAAPVEQQVNSAIPVDIVSPADAAQVSPVKHDQAQSAVPDIAPAVVPEPERVADAGGVADVRIEQRQLPERQLDATPQSQPLTTPASPPAHEAPAINADHHEGSTTEPATQVKNRVLIIEDDPIMRMLLKRGLSNFDFECLLTENGRAAQEILQKDHPDVLLVDLLMPVMDGLAFIKWLRHTAHDSTPVVVFTTVDNPKVKEEVLSSGADFFASKPLHVRELADTMRNLIASKRANQQQTPK